MSVSAARMSAPPPTSTTAAKSAAPRTTRWPLPTTLMPSTLTL